jgi:hypothetical protein
MPVTPTGVLPSTENEIGLPAVPNWSNWMGLISFIMFIVTTNAFI